MDKIKIFLERLDKINIQIKLIANYPWVYISEINGKFVTEKFQANHGFCLAITPVRKNQELQFTDITKIFELIRKYL